MPKKSELTQHASAKALAIRKYDLAISVIADIRTLAGLLEAVGTRADAEPVDATLLSMTGNMIIRQTDDLRNVLKTFLQPDQ